MKNLLLLCLISIILISNTVSAQSISRSSINSFGGVVKAGSTKLSQSVGQPSNVGVIKNSETKLRQGYQQPTTNTKHIKNTLSVRIYPNPTRSDLSILIEGRRGNDFSYYLFDSQGRICQSEKNAQSNKIKLDDNLNPGVYTMRVLTENKTGHASLIIIP